MNVLLSFIILLLSSTDFGFSMEDEISIKKFHTNLYYNPIESSYEYLKNIGCNTFNKACQVAIVNKEDQTVLLGRPSHQMLRQNSISITSDPIWCLPLDRAKITDSSVMKLAQRVVKDATGLDATYFKLDEIITIVDKKHPYYGVHATILHVLVTTQYSKGKIVCQHGIEEWSWFNRLTLPINYAHFNSSKESISGILNNPAYFLSN